MCSKQDIPCVRSRTFFVLRRKHFVCSNHQQCTCHFLVNSTDRPRIWANRDQIRPNPGTIGRIRQKMACESFELQTAQKSRGWLRFRRFLDEKDRGGPNFFFQNFRAAEIFASPKQFRDERANAHANERTNDRASKSRRITSYLFGKGIKYSFVEPFCLGMSWNAPRIYAC